MQVNISDSVAELRTVVQAQTGIASQEQRLIYKGRLLADDLQVKDLFKEDGETIHLSQKPAQTVPPVDPQAAQNSQAPPINLGMFAG